MNHDDPAYLDGLSELDRARAIVAVRWCGAEWVQTCSYPKVGGRPRYERVLVDDVGNADPALPIQSGMIPRYAAWGLNWTGTASLMELAKERGWFLSILNREADDLYWCCLFRNQGDCEQDDARATGVDENAAVLLACAAACQREVGE